MRRVLLTVVLGGALVCGGCLGFVPNSYVRARDTIAPPGAGGSGGATLTRSQIVERTAAAAERSPHARLAMREFCAMRASEVREDSYRHHSQDVALLVLGLAFAGLGSGFNGVAALVADDLGPADNADDVLAVLGTSSVALGAVFLTIRGALPLSTLQRAEREAAADFLVAAVDMAEAEDRHHADDFRAAAQRCAEIDERVGEAYATSSSDDALDALERRLRQLESGRGAPGSGGTVAPTAPSTTTEQASGHDVTPPAPVVAAGPQGG